MFWKRAAPPEDGNMGDDKGKTTTPNAEEVAKSALAAKESELDSVRKELADSKAAFAVELAKYKKDEPAPLPAEFQKRLDDETAKRVDLEKKLAQETDLREMRDAVE